VWLTPLAAIGISRPFKAPSPVAIKRLLIRPHIMRLA